MSYLYIETGRGYGGSRSPAADIYGRKFILKISALRKEVLSMPKTKRRHKGEGTFIQLPNGRYRAVVTISSSGVQKRKTLTCDTKEELVKQVALLKARCYNGSPPLETRNNTTFKEYVCKWLKMKEATVAPSTYESYETAVRFDFEPFFGDTLMSRIDKTMCNEYLQEAMRTRKNSTVRRFKVTLNMIFLSAVEDGIIDKAPTRSTIRIAKGKGKTSIDLPPETQIQELVASAKKLQGTRGVYKYLYPYLLLALATGLRKGEISGLQWNDIDFDKCQIHITTQLTKLGARQPLKTDGSYRTIYVDKKVLEEVSKIPRECDYVFYSTVTKNHFSIDRASKVVTKFFAKMGMPHTFTFHSMRHYHATELISKGVNVKVVSKRLGHSNIQTTLNLYVHYIPSMDEEASRLCGAHFIVPETNK